MRGSGCRDGTGVPGGAGPGSGGPRRGGSWREEGVRAGLTPGRPDPGGSRGARSPAGGGERGGRAGAAIGPTAGSCPTAGPCLTAGPARAASRAVGAGLRAGGLRSAPRCGAGLGWAGCSRDGDFGNLACRAAARNFEFAGVFCTALTAAGSRSR